MKVPNTAVSARLRKHFAGPGERVRLVADLKKLESEAAGAWLTLSVDDYTTMVGKIEKMLKSRNPEQRLIALAAMAWLTRLAADACCPNANESACERQVPVMPV